MLQSSSADNLKAFSCDSTDLMRSEQAVLQVQVVQAIATANTTLFDFGAPRGVDGRAAIRHCK